jgi:hypothetical protein
MIRLSYFTGLLICLITANRVQKQDAGSAAMMAVAPPSGSGDSFTSSCRNARVSGFQIFAKCQNFNGLFQNASWSFARCVYNYDGNLSRYSGSRTELYTRYCSTDGYYLNCSCQQPTGGYLSCSILLDEVFYVNNGRITC